MSLDMDSGGSGGLGGMFEKMPSMDAITVIVLGFDAYILYTNLGYNQGSLTAISGDPYILALQATILLVVIYTVEFLHDRRSGGH